MKAKLLLSVAVLLVLLLSACSQKNSATTSPEATLPVVTESTPDPLLSTPPASHLATTAPSLSTRWITLPEHLKLPGQASVEIAPSWEARIAKFPIADQRYLNEVNKRFFGSLGFVDEAEQRRLIEQGFPMPEEWLAARALSDVVLERLAKDGNLKAQMFWVDRVSVRVAPIAGTRGLSDTPKEKELFYQLVESMQMTDRMLLKSPSPFVAYLHGRLYSASNQYNPPEYIAGAFLLAKELGDPRADTYRKTYLRSHPGMDAESVISTYLDMKSRLTRNPVTTPK